MPVDVRGAVNGISAKTSEEVCSEVRPNDPGKIHQSAPSARNPTWICKGKHMVLLE